MALHKAFDEKGIQHTWRLIDGGGHSWGAGFQDQTLPYSFAMVGEMFSQAATKKKGLGELKDSLGGKADGEEKSKADGGK